MTAPRIDLEALRSTLHFMCDRSPLSLFPDRDGTKQKVDALVALAKTHLALDAAQHELDAAEGAYHEHRTLGYFDMLCDAQNAHQKAMEAARGALGRFK